MASVPTHPKIYHIVHVDRLAAIINNGNLYCDSMMMKRADAGPIIGMNNIKQRRLQLPVDCHAGTFVGDFVPFYFCPRSIMLYVIHNVIRERHIRSIAIPPLGSGLGGLKWEDVRHRIEAELGALVDIDILVFEPAGAPVANTAPKSNRVPHMTAGRAALIGLMNRYLGGLMDPFVTLLEVHKLMYFMQEAGEPLKLRYAKGPYGPYAENLSHVLKAIEGYYVTGYADGGDAPTKQLELIPGALPEANALLHERTDTQTRFDRVSALVEGFETPFGLELLSTVHWVAQQENATSPQQAVAKTYAWGERKRKFTERQIVLAYDVLMQAGWLQHEAGTPIARP